MPNQVIVTVDGEDYFLIPENPEHARSVRCDGCVTFKADNYWFLEHTQYAFKGVKVGSFCPPCIERILGIDDIQGYYQAIRLEAELQNE